MGRGAGVQGLAVEMRQAATEGTNRSCGHRRPRDIGGTLPGWVLRMRNVETPPWSGPGGSGGSTVRKTELLGGNRMAQEANAGGRKAAGNRAGQTAPPAVGSDDWPD